MENWNRRSGSCGQFVLFARAHCSINSTKVPSAIVEYVSICTIHSASTPNAKTIRTMPIERRNFNDGNKTILNPYCKEVLANALKSFMDINKNFNRLTLCRRRRLFFLYITCVCRLLLEWELLHATISNMAILFASGLFFSSQEAINFISVIVSGSFFFGYHIYGVCMCSCVCGIFRRQ